jgi:hypothetical protein
VSIQDLRQNPQDTSNFYLANMYQATINPDASSLLPTSPPNFTPPNYAVWVNGLWFLSLVISITCALLATLLQQWARRYLKVTQPRYSPHKRARIRSFFAEGVDKFLLPWAVEALPTMLHLSLFLFFAGLAVFLRNVNLTIFKLVLSWIGLCMALYGCITFIPIFRYDSPYHTPLSLPVWHFVMGMPYIVFQALQWLMLMDYFSAETHNRFLNLTNHYCKLLAQGMRKTAEECAFGLPSEIDTRAFLWTFDSLDEDHELERFFFGLPGFRRSKMVNDPLPNLTWEQQEKVLVALVALSDRTSSSDLLPGHIKIRRTVICRKAIGPADIPHSIQRVVNKILYQGHDGPAQSVAIAHLVKGWDNGKGEETTIIIQAIISSVIARTQHCDDLWFAMASDEMGVSESVLRAHATHGRNLSLVVLIHIFRKQFTLFRVQHWPYYKFSEVLEAASKFDVLDTSPGLQHEFCVLWNDVVRAADGPISWLILRPIRNIYLTLHVHTNSTPTAFSASTGDEDDILQWPSSYPLCNIPDHHHPYSTPHIHNVSASTSVLHSVLHDATLVLAFPPDDAPSLSLSVPVENPIYMPPLDIPASLYCTHQMPTESALDFSTSPDPAAASALRNSSPQTIPSTTCETSASTSVLPPTAVSLQSNANLLAHADAPEMLSLVFPEPMIDGITGLFLSLILS